MKSYEFVTVIPKTKGVIIGKFIEHREIIAEHAENGYRFVTAIPIETNANCYSLKFDLVFEK